MCSGGSWLCRLCLQQEDASVLVPCLRAYLDLVHGLVLLQWKVSEAIVWTLRKAGLEILGVLLPKLNPLFHLHRLFSDDDSDEILGDALEQLPHLPTRRSQFWLGLTASWAVVHVWLRSQMSRWFRSKTASK